MVSLREASCFLGPFGAPGFAGAAAECRSTGQVRGLFLGWSYGAFSK